MILLNFRDYCMTKALATVQLNVATGSIEAYIQRVSKVPLLTAEQELLLAKRYFEHQDLDAARQLVLAHLRFVIRIARGYTGYGLALGDLIQEGNVGLMKAVKRFNPQLGVRLVSFAVHWIKAEIHEFVIRNWRIVKIATTKAQRKLFFNLRSYKKRLGWFKPEEIAAIADDLNISQAEVIRMEERLNALDTPYDEPNDDDSSTQGLAPVQQLGSWHTEPSQVLEANHRLTQQQHLLTAVKTLDTRSQTIIEKRWLDDSKSTLHELADHFEVSAERIRQLEKNALKKLRNAIVHN